MIDRDEYTVRMMDLPHSVGGFITESPDGFANIYINARYGYNGQHYAFCHELNHAENDDLHSAEPLEVIEARAEGRDPRLKSIPNLLRARDLIPRPVPSPKPVLHLNLTIRNTTQSKRDLRTLYRIGVITYDWRSDPLLGQVCFEDIIKE